MSKPLLFSLLASFLASCGGAPAPAGSSLPDTFWSAQVPAGAIEVLGLRERASGDAVVVRGEIGDFVAGLAAFELVDHSIDDCRAMGGDDHCKTPWDYCCQPTEVMARGSATVEFHDGDRPIAGTVQGFHGIDNLSEVVVAGTLHVDEFGNMRVVATSVAAEKL